MYHILHSYEKDDLDAYNHHLNDDYSNELSYEDDTTTIAELNNLLDDDRNSNSVECKLL